MFDLVPLIKAAGYFGLFGIIFAESGLLIGFFLPGDSLLFTAGFLASQGYMNIVLVAAGSFLAAVVGDSAGYSFGSRFGPKVFTREESFFFKKSHIEKAQKFYEKHGGRTIILARFVPVVRTFAPILAGVGKMKYSTFLLYNILGGFLWAVGLTLLGWYLGNTIPDIDRYLLPIIFVIILISVMPGIVQVWRKKTKEK